MWFPETELSIHDHATEKVQIIKLECHQFDGLIQTAEPALAEASPQNVARLYDAFSGGETSRFATFEDALERHKMLDEI